MHSGGHQCHHTCINDHFSNIFFRRNLFHKEILSCPYRETAPLLPPSRCCHPDLVFCRQRLVDSNTFAPPANYKFGDNLRNRQPVDPEEYQCTLQGRNQGFSALLRCEAMASEMASLMLSMDLSIKAILPRSARVKELRQQLRPNRAHSRLNR